jgi:hypothetical protein
MGNNDLISDQVLQRMSPNNLKLNFSNNYSEIIEKYLINLIEYIISSKSQNSIIKNSIVAIDLTSSNSLPSMVTTRDVCRALRNFSGIRIPDLTTLTRVPVPVEMAEDPFDTPAPPMGGMPVLAPPSSADKGGSGETRKRGRPSKSGIEKTKSRPRPKRPEKSGK